MVEITDEMKKHKEERMAKIEKRIDDNIRLAVLSKNIECHFPCDKDRDSDVYDEIREKYEREGYKIKPTGYIGGVLQRTEKICW